jgi:hypothetical protein
MLLIGRGRHSGLGFRVLSITSFWYEFHYGVVVVGNGVGVLMMNMIK